LARLVVVGH